MVIGPTERPTGQFPWRATIGLLIVLVTAGLGCYACIQQLGISCDATSIALATAAVVMAMVPPLWLDYLIGTLAAAPLVTVAWRLGVLLPVIALTNHWIEPARNCVQVTLLACYFMALPLESWLLIRQTPTHRPSSPSQMNE